MRNVPELRFEGFDGEWEESKINDLVKINSGKDYKHLEEGVYPVYGTGGFITYVNEFLSEDDSIGIGRKGTINKPYKLKAPFWTVDTLFYATPKENFNIDYIFGLFQKINWLKYDESTGLPSLSKTNINNIQIYRAGAEEQEKIGDLFRKIDYLIENQEAKVSKMEDFKKSMLQKIFPKKGELVPEFRLDGFDGDWSIVKVGEIFKVTRGYVLSKEELSTEPTQEYKYPVYSSQTLNNGLMGYYNNYLYKDSTTWTTDGANAGNVKYRQGYFYATNVCGVLISEEGHSNYTIAEALNSVAYKHVSRVGNPKLMNNVMSEIEITVPKNLNEELKISEYIKKLDTQIENEQRLLDSYKLMKKSLLQKMFV